MEIVRTKGNVIVNEIKIGDIHYEYDMGLGFKSKVLTKPVQNDKDHWEWDSENLTTGKTIHYMVNPKFPACYAVNLYNYEAYSVNHYM